MRPFLIAALFVSLLDSSADAGPIYKYKNDKGVISFADDIEAIPKELRDQVEIIQKAEEALSDGENSRSTRDQVIIQGLLAIIGILLLWCLKLWIKKVVFKILLYVFIVIALIGLLYFIFQNFFIAPQNGFASKLPPAVTEGIERGLLPIQKAKETIKRFEKNQEEKEEQLKKSQQDEQAD